MSQIKPSFNQPMPTPEEQIVKAPPDNRICLWRGSYREQAERVVKFKTADGVINTSGIEPAAPSEEEAILQAAGGSNTEFFKRFPNGRMPEYTSVWQIAQQFANGYILIIAIKRRFLTKGSETEGGWIARWEAPLEAVRVQRYKDINKESNQKKLVNKNGDRINAD